MGFVSGNHILLLIIFLVIVLIIFGPGKLPDIGGAMGKGIREFRKASSDVKDAVMSHEEPPRAAVPPVFPAAPVTPPVAAPLTPPPAAPPATAPPASRDEGTPAIVSADRGA